MWPFRGREEAHLAEPDAGGSPGIALYSSPDLKNWKFETWLVKSSRPIECPETRP
jgi:sucrose-6-phosphate hydrolase SacC (GH32 family)